MQIDRWIVALCASVFTCAVFLCATPVHAATGQFSVGDVLVSDFGANHVQQFSPSGTLIRTFVGTGVETLGTAITPDGRLFVVQRNSNSSQHIGNVDIFSADGARIGGFNIPQLTYATDMAMFPDGTLAISDIGDNQVVEYTQAGAFVRTIPVPDPGGGGFHTGDAVAGIDGSLWVTSETSKVLSNFTESGTLVRTFSLPFEPRDLQVARDGTLWIGTLFDPNIYHYTATGSLINSIPTGLSYTTPIGLSPDESTLYTSWEQGKNIYKFSVTGQSLGSFPVPGATDLEYITVITPEPSSMIAILGVIACRGRRGSRLRFSL